MKKNKITLWFFRLVVITWSMVFSIMMYKNAEAKLYFNLATNILALLIVLVGWIWLEEKIKKLHG